LGMSSISHSSNLETRAFHVTISTRDDVSPECIKELVKHFSKTTDYAYAVTEHGESGKLHLHAVLLYKKSRSSGKLHANLWDRYVKPHHPDSKGRYAVKVQVCPGNKWYDEYLKKEADCTVVLDTYDRDASDEYFPSPVVQEALMEAGKRKGLPAPYIEDHVTAWVASSFENSPEGALTYLQHCMYVAKTMVPLDDLRRLTSKSVMYWKYRNGICVPTERESYMLRQLVEGPTYDVCARAPERFRVDEHPNYRPPDGWVPRAQPFVAAPPSI